MTASPAAFIRRAVFLPDALKIERFRRMPELGPKILFFSGGTALRDTAHTLTRYTHNAIHLITPFDSGGSSAILREAFNMPAVGDIRARIMALADQSVRGNPAIYTLFATRLSKNDAAPELEKELAALCKGTHPLIRLVPDPMRKIIRTSLIHFAEQCPKGFMLAGASIGNLVLTGGYLSNRRHLEPVIFIYSKLVEARGVVRPVSNAPRHLAVQLADGRVIVGQHKFTGKEYAEIASPIQRIWLTASLDSMEPEPVPLRPKVSDLISQADLICYPHGSFYSSLIANLLPHGVGKAVSGTHCPKVFIPNAGDDPELFGHSLEDQISLLLETLREEERVEAGSEVLNFILLDSARDGKKPSVSPHWLRQLGVEAVETPLSTPRSAPYYCPDLVSRALLSLC